MPSARTKGRCRFCNAEYTKSGMAKHLQACTTRKAAESNPGGKKARRGQLFHLMVWGRYASMYWMHLDVPADATLTNLDRFLRDTWLECCGHLSAFRIA